MADRLGVAPDDAVGAACYEVVHKMKQPPEFCPHRKLLTDGLEHTCELYEEHLGGYFNVSVSPVYDKDGNLIGFVHVARDITERKQADDALKNLNRQLQDFVYIASHDLREPLRKISSFGELLKEALDGTIADDDQENLDFMIDAANRMEQMIDALLAYSRVSSQEIPYRTVDLNELVEQLEQIEISALLEETDAAIEIPEPLPQVAARAGQVKQLLQNLIGNGIKYRREGIQPRIRIRSKPDKNNMVRIEVEDNGIGIKQQYHSDIFTMFKRLHPRGEYDGTGIGLALCKKIVEGHGGQIGVESNFGHGSTFWFTLPAENQMNA